MYNDEVWYRFHMQRPLYGSCKLKLKFVFMVDNSNFFLCRTDLRLKIVIFSTRKEMERKKKHRFCTFRSTC